MLPAWSALARAQGNPHGNLPAAGRAGGSTPCVGVLALQGDFREHRAMLQALGAATTEIRQAAELDADSVAAMEATPVSGVPESTAPLRGSTALRRGP